MTFAAIPARVRAALPAAAIFILTFAAYAPAIRGGLIWNDPDYVTRPELQPLGGLRRIWFEVGATEQYYPVLHSAFWLEHRLWGDAPAGYHALNVDLHALSACVFALVLIELGISGRVAWLAGACFALHPVEAESVAWISEQKNTLSTVFYLLAALAYLRGRRAAAAPDAAGRPRPGRLHYGVATGLFVLALLSKSVTATLPAALLVVLAWRQGGLGWRRDVRPLLPWFGLGAAVGLFTAWVEGTYAGAQGSLFSLGPVGRCLVAGRAIFFYLGKLLWPAHLSFIYPRWSVSAAEPLQWLPLAGALALTGVLAWRSFGPPGKRRPAWRAALCAWLFFVGSLFPTLGFFNVYAFVFSYVADHWQYLASLGILALAASAVPALGRAGFWAAGGVLALLGCLTFRQCGQYRDLETLYRTTLARNPNAWMVNSNLASLLLQQGHPAEAIPLFRRAEELAPTFPEIPFNLGDALMAAGRVQEAIGAYQEALRLRPDYALVHANLGSALLSLGRPAEAIPHFQEALKVFPGLANVRDSLGYALERTGRLEEAMAEYRRSIAIDPKAWEVHYRLANDLGNLGRYAEAAAEYRRALSANPQSAEAHANLGLALANLGRYPEAEAEIAEALRLRPGYAAARAYLGVALAQSGRVEDAILQFRLAIALSPATADFHAQLGQALREQGRTAEAAAEFAEASRLGGGAAP